MIGLENFIQKNLRTSVSQHLTACSFLKPTLLPPPSVPSVTFPAPEPMQVDSYHLTHAEHQKRVPNHLCLYCGGDVITCPVRPTRPTVSTSQLPPQIGPLSRTTVHILTPQICVSGQALIYLGSVANFISTQLLQKLNVRRKHCSQNLRIHTTQGKPLGYSHIRHFSSTLTLDIRCLHNEEITFMVLVTTGAPVKYCSGVCLFPYLPVIYPETFHSSFSIHLHAETNISLSQLIHCQEP